MVELSVVIPTYRRHDVLARTLAALERQTLASSRFEVIVVDDPKEDDPAAVSDVLGAGRRSFRHRQLHRHASGVSAARNAGWRAAQAPLILFLGDDIIAAPDLLEQHLEWQARHPEPETAVLGHVRWADELRRTPLMAWLDAGIQFDYGWLDSEPAGWGNFYTSNLSIKREMLERSGGFDEDRFPFGYEDTDLGYRLAKQGMRLLYNPRARAEHLHAPTLQEWAQRMRTIAKAERQWIAKHPEQKPYFEPRLREATRLPPARARLARAFALSIPRWFPVLGWRVWWHIDMHFRQQLAPHFFAVWDESPQATGAAATGKRADSTASSR